MKTTSVQIVKGVALSIATFEKSEELKKQPPINHIFVCDVSYSMVSSLQEMRTQLKNKIPSLVSKDGSTISIVWFSGRDQAGVLQQAVKVDNLTQLQKLNDAIDKFLKPVGATAFKKPLDIVKEVIDGLKKENPNSLNSMIFLTDGYNNDVAWMEVMKSLATLETELHSSCFVEYGYYADSKAIEEMAEAVGGSRIQAESFDQWDIEFEKLLTTNSASKKISVNIELIKEDLIAPVFFALSSTDEIIMYSSKYKKEILINEDTKQLFCLVKSGDKVQYDEQFAYLAAYVLLDKMKYDELDLVLGSLGDVAIYKKLMGAYGKQKLNQVKHLIKEAIFDKSQRFLEGKDSNFVPDKNAFCVIDMIEILMKEENFFMTQHPYFNYSKIGVTKKQRVDLNEEQKEKLAKAKTKAEADKILASIQAAEFVKDEDQLFPVDTIVWNESRANISFKARYTGMVKLPKNKFNLAEIPSFIFRNYTIIKDGILNVTVLPVVLTLNSFSELQRRGLLRGETYEAKKVYSLDFGHLPIINRSMVEKISAKDLAKTEYELLRTQAETKILKYLDSKLSGGATSVSLASKYGTECAQWLDSIGVTDSNGFAPPVSSEEPTDNYVGLELLTKIQSFSNLPKVEDVMKKIADNKKLTPSEKIMEPMLSAIDMKTVNPDVVKKLKIESNNRRKELLRDVATTKFSLILSKRWFKDLKDFDDNVLTMNFDSSDLKVTFQFNEKLIPV